MAGPRVTHLVDGCLHYSDVIIKIASGEQSPVTYLPLPVQGYNVDRTVATRQPAEMSKEILGDLDSNSLGA